eukprot:jgi/Bigna1/70207/fgenesh1_pg.11_\
MCFSSSSTYGVTVDALGSNTVFGQLAIDLSSSDKRKQPLKMKLESLAQTIAHLSYAGSMAIAVSFMFKQIVIDNHFNPEEMMEYLSNFGVVVHDCVTAVILAIIVVVCAVPEGLPTMIAVVLSLNMSRLLEDQVLVRHLLGIETRLGYILHHISALSFPTPSSSPPPPTRRWKSGSALHGQNGECCKLRCR